MLAYVFFHRPAAGVDRAAYEDRLRRFHRALPRPSAGLRLDALPFGDGGAGYVDWYLVDGWAELGALGDLALDPARRADHDHVAGLSDEGWGGVWALVRGDPRPPAAVRWTDKPRGADDADFVAALDAPTVWRRQLVLGPAPEFALVDPLATGDDRAAPGVVADAGTVLP